MGSPYGRCGAADPTQKWAAPMGSPTEMRRGDAAGDPMGSPYDNQRSLRVRLMSCVVLCWGRYSISSTRPPYASTVARSGSGLSA